MRISIIKSNRLADIIAAILIFLFVYTAAGKLVSIDSFKAVISKSPVLKENAGFLSWLIPSTELIISMLLFIPATREYGFLLSSILMGIFTLYIGWMLWFIPGLPCSCGGVIQQMSWPQHLVFNIIFFFLSLFGWKIKRSLNKDFIAINRKSRIPV